MTENVVCNDIEYKYAGRHTVDQFMPGDLIGGNCNYLIVKSEQLPNEPDHWVLHWKVLSTREVVEWNGLRTSADARYVPAQYVIEETP
jgi:hypothetical protein